MDMRISPSALSGTIRIPGSKSHTIRSLLLSLLSEGQSVITGALTSGDGAAAINAARSFGAAVIEEGDTLTITGVGGNLIAPKTIIDTANSGTTTTLFSSVAALSEGFTIITGDEQIRRRSIAPLIEALNGLGAHAFFTHPSRTAPPVVIGGTLGGGRVTVDGSNSQVVSSLLLACPLAAGDSEITVTNALETPYVRLTLDWMERYGVRVDHDGSYTHYTVKGGQSYRAGDHTIAADWSSAAFPLVAGAITPSRLTIEGLDFFDAQGDRAIVSHLRLFGADLVADTERGTITVQGGKPLSGGHTIDLGPTPDMLPALAVLATQAAGTTRFTNLSQVRQKETDRVAEMQRKLTSLGCSAEIDGDDLVVAGKRAIVGGRISSEGDHRIAMALAVAGLASQEGIVIEDGACAAVSFPLFVEKLSACGAKIQWL
jgi:3-phosphoshikimate 1-carboxyvinyltransferase